MKIRIVSIAMLFILFWNRDNNADEKETAKTRIISALDLGERTVLASGSVNIGNSDGANAPFEIQNGVIAYGTAADYVIMSRANVSAALGSGELNICLLAGALTILDDEINISNGSDVKFEVKDGLKTTVFVINTTYQV